MSTISIARPGSDIPIKRKWSTFENYLIWLIVATTLVRCVVALSVELGNDEVYYFTYAVQPDWNHFDHPPLVGIFIRIFTLNLHWINDLSVRLPAILGAAFNTWLIARCGYLIKNERTGLIAAVLYNTSLYASIISGIFIIPDSVQLTFWLGALHSIMKALSSEDPKQRRTQILMTGLWIGIAVMCKVHGVFLWFGILGYVIFHHRSWLKEGGFYIAIVITLLIISPIIYWNFNNDFISWHFHSERVDANQGINLKSFLTAVLGQIAYNNPLNIWLFILTVIGIIKQKQFVNATILKLLLWCSLPIILATCTVSLFRPILPHWSGPGFVGCILLSSAYVDFKLDARQRLYPRLLRTSALLMVIVILAGVTVINFYPGTLGNKMESKMGAGDFTLDMTGWKELSKEFNMLRVDDIASKRMPGNAPLVTHKWFPGGHQYYYVAYPNRIPFLGLGQLNDLHKFLWLNELQSTAKIGSDAYFITSSDSFTDPHIIYKGLFRKIDTPRRIMQKRAGHIARYWFIYRLHFQPEVLQSNWKETFR